jgi:hypothetical protein
MPKKSGTGAQYRFSPKDLVKVYGWYGIGGSVDVF